jgi:hypothetical protein
MISISVDTSRRIEALFPEQEWRRVSDYLMNECGDNLPLVETSYTELAERIRFAVLKLSRRNFGLLVEESQHAAIDWRDILVAAGFADDPESHLAWEPGLDPSK